MEPIELDTYFSVAKVPLESGKERIRFTVYVPDKVNSPGEPAGFKTNGEVTFKELVGLFVPNAIFPTP